MNAEYFRLVYPKNYHELFHKEEIRADERSFLESRFVKVEHENHENANGSSKVALGNTKVFCGIRAEASATKPGENILDFMDLQVTFPFVSAQSLRTNQTLEQTQIANFVMENFIQSTGLLKADDLTDCDGKVYWKLNCELVCVEDDGCLHDACSVALLAALRDVKLPVASLNKDSEGFQLDEKEKRSLQLRGMPLILTFATWSKDVLLADPTKEEEELGEGIISITYDSVSDLFGIFKSSGCALEMDFLDKCYLEAKKRSKKILAEIQGKS